MPLHAKSAKLRLSYLLGLLMLAACSDGPTSTPQPTVFIMNVEPTPVRGTAPADATGGVVPPAATPGAVGTAVAIGTPGGELSAAPWLMGRLLMALGGEGIFELALPSGATTTLFPLEPDTWLTSISVRPDDGALAVAYAPAPPEGIAQLGYTSIYLLPGDCVSRTSGCTSDDLTPLVERLNPTEAYFSPVWAPDGHTLYFAHFTPSNADTGTAFRYTLERMAFAEGAPASAPELVAEDALWPAVSPDSRRIAYIYTHPVDYTNYLMVADADGANPNELVGPGLFQAIDSPLFSADGSQIIFSAVDPAPLRGPTPAPVKWLDQLLGVRVVEAAPPAHMVPSDWWTVPTESGTPTRLTEVADTGMYGDIGPDGEHLAYLSASGLYVMGMDGTGLMRLSKKGGYGTLEWLP